MNQQAFLQMDDGLEHQEQLYLLEVLVDNIVIEESKVPSYLLEPYGPLVVKAKFLDLPDLEFDQGKCPLDQDDGEPTLAGKIIAGAPESWKIEAAKDQPDFEKYPQYRVIIPITRTSTEEGIREDVVRILVPHSAVVTGEGLRYINAVVKTDLDPATLEQVHHQVEEEARRRAADTSTKISEYTFAAGKSLLFPMTPYKLIQSLRKTPFYLQVTRSGMYANDKPFFTLIGQVKLLLGDSFVKAIMAAGNTKVLPVSAYIEDQYPISNVFGDQTGKISVFLRLSCFGKYAIENERQDLLAAPGLGKPQSSSNKKFRPIYSDEQEEQIQFPGTAEEKLSKPVPWRKVWDDIPEYQKPPPSLPPFYEPLPPLPPPPPPKPFDIGEHLPDLPRCGPHQPPPCYRRAGDPPLSYCTRDMEAQLRREEVTKYTQTDAELQIENDRSRPYHQRKKNTETNLKNFVPKLGVQPQDLDKGKMKLGDLGNCECDGEHYKKRRRSVDEAGHNRFDGIKKEDEEEQPKMKNQEKPVSLKNCTCPRIPDLLLPQPGWKPKCGCKCGAFKAKIAQEKKVNGLLREKLFPDRQTNDETGSNKERSEKLPKTEELKTAPQFPETQPRGVKKFSEMTFPKRDDVFFLPGADSSTHIALTSQECGHDLIKYIERAKERGEYEEIRKHIDPNPISGWKLNKMPDKIKKGLEKEVKMFEEKSAAVAENVELRPTNSRKLDKEKKKENLTDNVKKPGVKRDGGKAAIEKISSNATKPPLTKKEQRVKSKIKASNIYEYTAGMYPGIHVGHKYCVRPLRLVPKTMGWLWNISDLGGILKPGRGWRPGAVHRNVNNFIKEWRTTNKGNRDMKPEQELDMIMMTTKPQRTRPTTPKSPGSKKDNLQLNPTIRVHKKDRFYYVSMYPVKTESQEELGEEPQPIQFKIDRKHPDGKPTGDEPCFSSTDTSSDSSSYEVEYIAPAAMKQKKRKADKAHKFSQYDEDDFTPKKVQKKGAKPSDEQQEAAKKQEVKPKKGKKALKKGKKVTKKNKK